MTAAKVRHPDRFLIEKSLRKTGIGYSVNGIKKSYLEISMRSKTTHQLLLNLFLAEANITGFPPMHGEAQYAHLVDSFEEIKDLIADGDEKDEFCFESPFERITYDRKKELALFKRVYAGVNRHNKNSAPVDGGRVISDVVYPEIARLFRERRDLKEAVIVTFHQYTIKHHYDVKYRLERSMSAFGITL